MGRPPFESYFAFRRFQPALAFDADGRSLLYSSDLTGQFNLCRVSIDGGEPEQLTDYADSTVRVIAVRPQDGTIVFTADTDGDEFYAPHVLRPGGEPQRLTEPGPVQHFMSSSAFSPDGSVFVYAANARRPDVLEVFVRDVDGGDARPVFAAGNFSYAGHWSPDGTKLVCVEAVSNSEQRLHLVDVATGASDELTRDDGPAKFEPGPWARDGSGFYLLTDVGAEYTGVAFYDVEQRSWSYVHQPDADVEELAASHDGKLAWIENDRGWGRLRVRDAPDAELPPGTTHPLGSQILFSPDGARLALRWESSRRPQEIYAVDAATGAARRVTDSALELPSEDELVEPELVAIPGGAGRDIPAWLYRADVAGPAPVAMYVHGGPESQSKAGYLGILQYLCSRGIHVLVPNIRGSTGYGKTYQRSLYRDWGYGDLQDFETIGNWLRAQDWADGARLAVFGGSYGGYATLLCVSRLPEMWAVGVDIFGPSSLLSLIATAPPTWHAVVREMIGDPDRERERLLGGSPLTYADEIRAPLLVIQGGHDPRVVPAESEQLVARLRELGRDVEYVVFEDEGHGFTRHENEVRAWRLTGEFIERHLAS